MYTLNDSTCRAAAVTSYPAASSDSCANDRPWLSRNNYPLLGSVLANPTRYLRWPASERHLRSENCLWPADKYVSTEADRRSRKPVQQSDAVGHPSHDALVLVNRVYASLGGAEPRRWVPCDAACVLAAQGTEKIFKFEKKNSLLEQFDSSLFKFLTVFGSRLRILTK